MHLSSWIDLFLKNSVPYSVVDSREHQLALDNAKKFSQVFIITKMEDELPKIW